MAFWKRLGFILFFCVMKNKESDWKRFHHQLYQIYHGTIAASLVPFALQFLEWDSQKVSGGVSDVWNYVLVILAALAVFYGSWQIWKGSRLQYSFQSDSSLKERLDEFKRINTQKYVLLFVMGLLCAGLMWLTPSFVLVLGYFSVLVQYSLLRPSEDKVVRDMQLSKRDRDELHKKSIAQD